MVERYDLRHNTWTEMPQLKQKRQKASSCILGNTAYVFGGHSGSKYLASMEKLSLDGIDSTEWDIIHPPPSELTGRQQLIVVPLSQSRILIFGGEDRQSNNDAIEFDTHTCNFMKLRQHDDNELDI